MALLSFQQAIERARREKRAAFAFCPIVPADVAAAHAEPVGANLFVLAHAGNAGCCVHYVGGRYGTPKLVRQRYGPDEAPKDARLASYHPLEQFDEVLLKGELQSIHTALLMLAGS